MHFFSLFVYIKLNILCFIWNITWVLLEFLIHLTRNYLLNEKINLSFSSSDWRAPNTTKGANYCIWRAAGTIGALGIPDIGDTGEHNGLWCLDRACCAALCCDHKILLCGIHFSQMQFLKNLCGLKFVQNFIVVLIHLNPGAQTLQKVWIHDLSIILYILWT